MAEISTILSLIFFGLAFYYYRKNGIIKYYWASPASITIIFYIFNYPLKALYNIAYKGNLDTDDYPYLLIYVGLYVLIFVYMYIQFDKIDSFGRNVRQNILQGIAVENFARMTFWIIFAGFLYKIANGSFFALENNYERSTAENILINFMAIQYSVIFICLHLARTKNKKYYINVLVLSIFILYESLLSTSKAPIFNLVILYLFANSYHGIEIKKIYLVPPIAIGILFYFYSYTARYTGLAFESTADINTVLRVLEATFDNFYDYYDQIVEAMFERFELFDNLNTLKIRYELIDPGLYRFGSLIEVINLIPKILWRDRPFVLFNVFVQYEIIGYKMDGVTMSIGRMGEAFFLLKYAGILIAVFYAYIFSKAFNRLFVYATSPVSVILYVNLFFNYFIHDNYLTQGLFTIVFSSVLIVICYKIAVIFSKE